MAEEHEISGQHDDDGGQPGSCDPAVCGPFPAVVAPRLNPPCANCGGPHPFDTSVPSVRWNAVIRKAGLPDYLCLTCIVSAFVKAGESFTAQLAGDEHVLEPIEVRTRSQNATDAAAIQRENNGLRWRLRELELALEATAPQTCDALRSAKNETVANCSIGQKDGTSVRRDDDE